MLLGMTLVASVAKNVLNSASLLIKRCHRYIFKWFSVADRFKSFHRYIALIQPLSVQIPVPWAVTGGSCVLCVEETLGSWVWMVEVVVGFLVALVVVVVVVVVIIVVGTGWLGVVGLVGAFGRRGVPVLFSAGGATEPGRKVKKGK